MGEQARGFTIIETTLFLAISGLLILLMVAGSGATISAQRYKDAAQTLKTLIQQQYSQATNVHNERVTNVACNPATATIVEITSGTSSPGQSNCLIMGRFMYLNGGDVKLYDVIGYTAPTTKTINDNDFDALRKYTLNVSQLSVEDKEMDWATSVRSLSQSGAGASTQLGILFIRAPDTGNLYTLTTRAVPNDPTTLSRTHFAAMIADTALASEQRGQYICVDSDSSVVPGSLSAVYISPNAVGASAIEVYSNTYMTAQGMGTQC